MYLLEGRGKKPGFPMEPQPYRAQAEHCLAELACRPFQHTLVLGTALLHAGRGRCQLLAHYLVQGLAVAVQCGQRTVTRRPSSSMHRWSDALIAGLCVR